MAFTTYPPAGSPLRSTVLQALISEVRPVSARKTVDETINNSTTYQLDDELTLLVEANCVYLSRLLVVFASSVTADFKIALDTLPAGATATDWIYAYQGVTDVVSPTTGLGGVPGNGVGSKDSFTWTGLLVTSSTAGTATWKWAQNTLDPTNTTVYTNSVFELRRLS